MRPISRRSFLSLCSASAASLALDPFDLSRLGRVLADPAGPTVLWLQGSGCTGCTMSLLNYISPAAPENIADVLIHHVNLVYHPNLSPVAGESVVALVDQVRRTGNFILAVEGGIPTQFNGGACYAWTHHGVDVTFEEAIRELAPLAAAILCMGTCAAWGGIPAAPPNPTGVLGVRALTGRQTINIAGCPPHPDWMVWGIVQLLLGKSIPLDSAGRPQALYTDVVHKLCPRRGTQPADTFALPDRCLKDRGCLGPNARGNCPVLRWNNHVNWCIGANANCIDCTSPTFPSPNPFIRHP